MRAMTGGGYQRLVFQLAYYDRKRAEGKRHRQALIALARRRVRSYAR